MSEPLPLSNSSRPPQRSGGLPALKRARAWRVAMPRSKTSPWGVQWASSSQRRKRLAMSLVLRELLLRRDSTVQRMRELSSDQVPGGWLWVPKPRMSVTGSCCLLVREVNSTGTPRASPVTAPQREPRIWLSIMRKFMMMVMLMIVPGCQFASDNTAGICVEAWEALGEANCGYESSYGDDGFTRKACDQLRELFEKDCDVYFVFTGTAANALALASLCQSYHSVITHQAAHVETDECGAPEFFSNGSKILLASGEGGKCDVGDVRRLITLRTDLHYPKPKVLSISQSTEYGTVYEPGEIGVLWEGVKGHGLHLHMDGARFANAVASSGVSAAELTWKAGVEVLCFGGTKMGMAMTEAVVFFNRELSEDFSWRCKQAGQLNSKMRFASAQWLRMIGDGAWLRHARNANAMASLLAEGLRSIAGVELLHEVQANAVFAILSPEVEGRLRATGWKFYQFIGGGARFMCSWKTTREEVESLLATARG